jgi:hypothetical protein
MAKAWAFLAASGLALMAGGQALAQSETLVATQSEFARDRNVSVAERPRPGYDAIGVPLGGFTAYPSLTVGVEENDNIYAAQADKHSDTIFNINPELDLNSNWARNQLQAFVRAASRQYDKFTTESSTDYQLGASGRLDVGRGRLIGGADYGRFAEPRTDVNASPGSLNSVKPIEYDQTDAFVGGVEELNRLRLTGRFDYQKFDYQNGRDANGDAVDEHYRNRDVEIVSGKAEYAISPDTSVYLAASYNNHSYDQKPPQTPLNRDSHGEDVAVGADFDLTHLLRGQIQVGYLTQDFDAHTFGTISGLSANGKLEWFPTQLTTVTFIGSRAVQDAAVDGSPAYLANVFNVQVDHELLRNLILTGRIGIENDDYQSIDRNDQNQTAYVGASYLMNRHVGFTLSYNYLNQDSSGSARGPKYKVNLIQLSSKLQF